jgi:glycosyltransferase involved in cell wall biosynthesis
MQFRPPARAPWPPRSTETPFLTVILPHFKCEAYLRDAVCSILNQEMDDLGLILVDDSSPSDAWIDAVRPFLSDTRLTILRTSRNVGHYRIKNAVLDRIRSPYVAFQDADDVSHPTRLLTQLTMLERNRADIVGCGFDYVDAEGAPIRTKRMVRNSNRWLALGRSFVLLHPTTVARRPVFDFLGGFDGTARIAADADFILRAAHVYRIRNIQDPLYQYRVRPGSLMTHPDTAPDSIARREYVAAMWERERLRRQTRTRAERESLLRAPENDIEFEVRSV